MEEKIKNFAETKAVFTGNSSAGLFARGVVLLLLGILLLCRPILTVTVITVAIGVFLICSAFWTLGVVLSIGGRGRFAGVVYALLTLVLGITAVVNPLLMDCTWIFLLGCWQIAAGVNGLFSIRRNGPKMRFITILNSLTALFVGVVFIIWPFSGLVAASWLPGIFLIMFSALFFSASIRA